MGLVNMYHGYDRENLLATVISISNLYATDMKHLKWHSKVQQSHKTYGLWNQSMSWKSIHVKNTLSTSRNLSLQQIIVNQYF